MEQNAQPTADRCGMRWYYQVIHKLSRRPCGKMHAGRGALQQGGTFAVSAQKGLSRMNSASSMYNTYRSRQEHTEEASTVTTVRTIGRHTNPIFLLGLPAQPTSSWNSNRSPNRPRQRNSLAPDPPQFERYRDARFPDRLLRAQLDPNRSGNTAWNSFRILIWILFF